MLYYQIYFTEQIASIGIFAPYTLYIINNYSFGLQGSVQREQSEISTSYFL